MKSRLLPADVFRVGVAGLRTRPLRVFLSALGIAIGIAAMVCVIGITGSSREELDRKLSLLGTNMLKVMPGQDLHGRPSHLPAESVDMVKRIGPVTSATATGMVQQAVYRNDQMSAGETGNLSVLAARTDLLETVGVSITSGVWLNEATSGYPVVVLGKQAARRLGVPQAGIEAQVWLGGQWFTVIGILGEAALTPELDYAALVGWPAAQSMLRFDGYPTTIYTRTRDDAVLAVQSVLGRTANPESPNEVRVSRPSDALAARQAADTTLTGLLLGLGVVALLVGGVGVANTMVISVLERRGEIGLRRSLGATRRHIRHQFLAESLLLSLIGGGGGVLLGIVLTAAYASYQGWPVVVPAWASLGSGLATVVIGVCAGIYPARRASSLSPAEALASPG